ncbi:hypothetical protein GCM10027047_04570 [Rhodococcus aerolatus]
MPSAGAVAWVATGAARAGAAATTAAVAARTAVTDRRRRRTRTPLPGVPRCTPVPGRMPRPDAGQAGLDDTGPRTRGGVRGPVSGGAGEDYWMTTSIGGVGTVPGAGRVSRNW